MRIITYTADDPNTPADFRCYARIRADIQGKNGKWVDGFMPISFNGSTPEEVREKAQTFWEDQLEKLRANAVAGKGRRHNILIPTPATDFVGDVV